MLGIVASYHCMQFQGKLINETWENGKTPCFGPDFDTVSPNSAFQFFFFKNLAPSVTRYYGHLSSCTISEKTNDPILRKLSDGRTDRGISSPLNLEKRPTAKKCCWIWKLWRQNINYDGKNIPSCMSLMTAKLDWLIGKTSLRIATYQQEDVWEENMLFIPLLKNQMYDIMNAIWKAVFRIEIKG